MPTSAKQAVSSRTRRTARTGATNARGEASLKLIIDTTERLMLDEGYAAVSSRRVAKEAGLKPPLVHYYFPATDDLFLAVFRRAAAREAGKLDDAVQSAQSPESLWSVYCNQEQTALAMEFMALANHRKAIREEIAAMTRRERQRRARILAALVDVDAIQPPGCSTAGLNVLLIAVARTLVMEAGLGITLGHDDARQFVQWWLQRLGKPAG
jgi:AcrR family transcriptional regulator